MLGSLGRGFVLISPISLFSIPTHPPRDGLIDALAFCSVIESCFSGLYGDRRLCLYFRLMYLYMGKMFKCDLDKLYMTYF
jgi:hypothetical protein